MKSLVLIAACIAFFGILTLGTFSVLGGEVGPGKERPHPHWSVTDHPGSWPYYRFNTGASADMRVIAIERISRARNRY
ncbi:MAG: hypothetical protein AAGF59_01925 [Pseudomonadota bacterium]